MSNSLLGGDRKLVSFDPLPVEEKRKNFDGSLGPICNYCAGLGFTNTLGGQSAGCPKCDQTGVKPTSPYELQRQIDEIRENIGLIIQHLANEGIILAALNNLKKDE